jgi:cell division transport system permease protein
MSGGHRPGAYLASHLQSALASLGRLSRSPIGSLMTILVIGIALALPAGLNLLLSNLRIIGGQWDGAPTLSLFLRQEAKEGEARALAERLGGPAGVGQAELITREQALAEFRQYSGFGEGLDLLKENPLPTVILIRPGAGTLAAEALERLAAQLRQEPLVEQVQIDLDWVRRFAAIAEIAQRVALGLAVLLSLSVVLIIGNTIRLEIRNRLDEIIIIKQVGGTDAFVRRPFLYSGLWLGLFGALAALSLLLLGGWLLQEPVSRLAQLYQSDFRLNPLDPLTLGLLLGGGPLIGLLGARTAIGRHLADIEP